MGVVEGRRMREALYVGAGGFLGAVGRYYLGGLLTQLSAASRFPAGTFTVNLLGCLAIGVLGGAVESRHLLSPDARLFLFTGVLGGFTTYSAFAFETYFLMREHAWKYAFANVVLQVLLCLAAVALGFRLAHGR